MARKPTQMVPFGIRGRSMRVMISRLLLAPLRARKGPELCVKLALAMEPEERTTYMGNLRTYLR